MRLASWTLAALVALPLAGCLTEPQEALCPGRDYVTIHYDERLDRDLLRAAFEEAGYAWRPEERPLGNVMLEPPARLNGGVFGVVAPDPGPSAEGTTVSFEEREAERVEPAQVRAVAQDAARVVNATFGDPPIAEWVEGEHEAEGC